MKLECMVPYTHKTPALEIVHSKIYTREKLLKQMAVWRFTQHKIVFTNGCFDILHAGHLNYLEKARSLGDVLVVGVNSDESVQRLKGKSRPIIPCKQRMLMLAF